MKVFIIHAHIPETQESWFLNEISYLSENGMDFLIACRNYEKNKYSNKFAEKYKDKLIEIDQFPNPNIAKIGYIIYFQILTFIRYSFEYLDILKWITYHPTRMVLRSLCRILYLLPSIRLFNPDIIYTHWPDDPSIMALLMSKMFRKKLIINLHSYYKDLSYFQNILTSDASFIYRADYIRKLYLRKYPSLSGNNHSVIPCGIDTEFFKPSNIERKQPFLSILLTVCRFVEMKGINYTLKACKLLKDKGINLKYILVGYGPEKRKYLDYIRKKRLQKFVKIHPPLSHSKKLLKIFSKSEIFVLPSIIDSKGEVDVIPNACLEAMAMELVVVTTRVGGMDEVITDGVNGFFCKEKDPEDLARVIKKVMDLPVEKRREIGKKAREVVVKRFDKDKQGKKFVDFLKSQVIDSRKS